MRLRPPTDADAEAAAALVIAVDVKEMGEADYTLDDLHDEWREPGFELHDDAVIAEDGDTAVGYAHFRGHDVMVCVDPAREGQGAGTMLHAWAEARARERGMTTLRQMIGDRGASGRAFLHAHGYEKVRSYWRMERDVARGEAGFRAFQPADVPALYAIREAAFSRNPDYEPATEPEWTAREIEIHSFDPELTRVATEDGEPVGFATVRRWEDGVAYLSTLAVRPEAWGRGLGSSLLEAVFAAAGAAGRRQVHLNVASDNPNALRLYERVGMTQRWRVDAYERPVAD
jgi:ribosomal protein S18 acetylase RimI-like enzyme